MNKTTYMKRALITALCGAGLWAGSAAAHGYDGGYHQDRASALAREYDRKGDRIERRLDRKGDRIERRLERRADLLRLEGRYAEAARLERKGERINRRLDREGRQINRRLDRKGERLARQWEREHAPRHIHERRVYRDAHRDVHGYRTHAEPQVSLVFDLGRWVIRP